MSKSPTTPDSVLYSIFMDFVMLSALFALTHADFCFLILSGVVYKIVIGSVFLPLLIIGEVLILIFAAQNIRLYQSGVRYYDD